jgi:osmoprotectant transport system ATP-binding protein
LKWKERAIDERVDFLLKRMGMEPREFSERMPHQLSGGQNQRVGIARALALDPPILLMDEPFASLDPIMRDQLQNEFLELKSDIKKTLIFVTHDFLEAIKLADRIAFLEDGRLVQLAPPQEFIQEPKSPLIAQFLKQHRGYLC